LTNIFLTDTQNESSNAEVDLKVMLPDRSIKTVQVERNSQVEQVLELILQSLEAVRDVDQGRVKATNAIGKLKYLEDTDKKEEYINVVKKLSGFNCLAFPHCLSSVRGDGYVIPRMSSNALEFAACTPSGEEENATVQLDWNTYQEHLLQEDGSIVIAFSNEDETKESRSIHIRTIYGKFMMEGITKIFSENQPQHHQQQSS